MDRAVGCIGGGGHEPPVKVLGISEGWGDVLRLECSSFFVAAIPFFERGSKGGNSAAFLPLCNWRPFLGGGDECGCPWSSRRGRCR